MSFILRAQRAGWPETFRSDWERYESYLAEQGNRFPPQAFSLAKSPWYYDASTSRCPHDAWLESFTINEPALGERHQKRILAATIRLLGSYHDGYLEFHYPQVFSYDLQAPAGLQGHGDWLYDEFRLSEAGYLVHEIEWATRSRWLIEASDVALSWLPGGPAPGTPDPDA
jgi:hypothetical protein